MSRPLGDDLMLRRAARRVGLQTAGLVAAAMVLLVVAVSVVIVRGQDQATDQILRSTVSTADDVGDPPPGVWLVIVTGAQVAVSPGLPAKLDGPLAVLRAGSLKARPTTLASDDGAFRVLTRRKQSHLVQVVLSLRAQHEERARLARAATVAGALSLLVALALGAWLGRHSVRPLAEALALQRGFIADASHELRTPLTLLSTRVQLLARGLGDVDAQVRADVEGVVRDVQRLGEVVDDLLVAADPRRDDQHHPVDVGQLLSEVAQSVRAHAAGVGVGLDASGLPVAGVATVMGSAPALRRAVLALVDNAVEHTPPGGTVSLGAANRAAAVVIVVSDTGPGIAPEATGRLVRRFHSGGQRAGRAHYGLGLALTHDVANRHGGGLRLVPSDSGATFELSFPAIVHPGQDVRARLTNP